MTSTFTATSFFLLLCVFIITFTICIGVFFVIMSIKDILSERANNRSIESKIDKSRMLFIINNAIRCEYNDMLDAYILTLKDDGDMLLKMIISHSQILFKIEQKMKPYLSHRRLKITPSLWKLFSKQAKMVEVRTIEQEYHQVIKEVIKQIHQN